MSYCISIINEYSKQAMLCYNQQVVLWGGLRDWPHMTSWQAHDYYLVTHVLLKLQCKYTQKMILYTGYNQYVALLINPIERGTDYINYLGLKIPEMN